MCCSCCAVAFCLPGPTQIRKDSHNVPKTLKCRCCTFVQWNVWTGMSCLDALCSHGLDEYVKMDSPSYLAMAPPIPPILPSVINCFLMADAPSLLLPELALLPNFDFMSVIKLISLCLIIVKWMCVRVPNVLLVLRSCFLFVRPKTQLGKASHNILKALVGAGAVHLSSGMCGQECHASMHCVRMVLKVGSVFILQIVLKNLWLVISYVRAKQNIWLRHLKYKARHENNCGNTFMSFTIW